MAIYHLSIKAISRKAGRSATGAAAYRAGDRIYDERTGMTFDYTHKNGVLHSELLLPGGEQADRGAFWNGLELHHKRQDAIVAREVEVALPSELSAAQRQELAVGFARELADRYGVAADVALHAPRPISDAELARNPHQYHETDPALGRHNGNWHAHILLSACYVSPEGTLGRKAVELDPIHCQRHRLENVAERERAHWAERANQALVHAGHAPQLDARSHADRGFEQEPSRHLGPAAAGYERRTGQPSHRRLDDDQNVHERRKIAAELRQLDVEAQRIDCALHYAHGHAVDGPIAPLDPHDVEAGLALAAAQYQDWRAAQALHVEAEAHYAPWKPEQAPLQAPALSPQAVEAQHTQTALERLQALQEALARQHLAEAPPRQQDAPQRDYDLEM